MKIRERAFGGDRPEPRPYFFERLNENRAAERRPVAVKRARTIFRVEPRDPARRVVALEQIRT